MVALLKAHDFIVETHAAGTDIEGELGGILGTLSLGLHQLTDV